MVGSTLTRRSTGWPPTVRRMRPSCGSRRSAMSRLAMTLMRVVMAKARCRGGGTISYSTPSARMRILNSFSNGSKCKSLAWSLMASSSTMFKSLRTGALSARASTLVRSSAPSLLQGLGRRRQRGVLLHVGDQRLDALAPRRVVAVQRPRHVLLRGHHRPDVVAQEAPQLVDDRQLLRIAHGDRQRVVLEADGHDAVELGHGLGDVGQHVGRHHHVGQADHLHAHLLGQPLGQLLVGRSAPCRWRSARTTRPAAAAAPPGALQPVLGEEAEVHQNLSDPPQGHDSFSRLKGSGRSPVAVGEPAVSFRLHSSSFRPLVFLVLENAALGLGDPHRQVVQVVGPEEDLLLLDDALPPERNMWSSSNCMPSFWPVWIAEVMRKVLFSRIRLAMAGVTTSIS